MAAGKLPCLKCTVARLASGWVSCISSGPYCSSVMVTSFSASGCASAYLWALYWARKSRYTATRSASVTANAGTAAHSAAVAPNHQEELRVAIPRTLALFKEVVRYLPFATTVMAPQFRAGHEKDPPVHPPAQRLAVAVGARQHRHQHGPAAVHVAQP